MQENNFLPPAVLHILTSQAWGGLELYAINFIKNLKDTGIRTALYCRPHSKVSEEACKLGIPIYEAGKKSYLGIRDILQVKKIVEREKFNILHSHTRQDVRLASLALIFGSVQAKQIFSLYMSAPAKKSPWHRLIYGKVAAIVSSSEILNERIRKNYPVLPKQVHLLRYGRDVSLYQKNMELRKTIRQKCGASEDDIVIGTMCRIDPAKGVREIAESLLYLSPAHKKKIKIWIMGEPTLHHTLPDGTQVYEEKSEQLSHWLKDFAASNIAENRITLIPFQCDIIPYLSAFDIFVLATYKETYSLSMIDAMCMGLPVIGTNSGGTPEQVEGRGLLVEPQSPQGIAQAIKTYLEHPELMEKYATLAQNWAVAQHSWANTLAAIQELYVNTLND